MRVYDNVQEAWNDYINERYTDFADSAEKIISKYEAAYEFEWEEEYEGYHERKTEYGKEQTSSNEHPAAPAVTEKQSWIKQTLASAKDKADEINRTHETKKQNIDKSL